MSVQDDEVRDARQAEAAEGPRPVRLGTRRSLLARTQSGLVAIRLAEIMGRPVELVEVVTEGDVNLAPMASIGGTGVFVSAVRKALLAGEVDVIVHSLKDLPTTPEDGIVLAAVPTRVDPRDVLVARDNLTLGELPSGSRVATGSLRRRTQLEALGLGLELVGIRGNVDTRMKAVSSGEVDAVVLARAGLLRLGRADEATQVLDPQQMLPAPGQGALAIEARAVDPAAAGTTAEADVALLAALAGLDDPETRACVEAERAVLSRAEAGCSSPLGALAEVVEGDDGPELSISATLAGDDGHLVRQSLQGPVSQPTELGVRLADLLLERLGMLPPPNEYKEL